MSNIISINYLLQFLILIYIIPIYITIETKLEFAFLNGFNVIRCSDQQVQVYLSNDKVLTQILECKNKKAIYNTLYTGFKWDKLELICSSDDSKVHEEQSIIRTVPGENIERIPDLKGQLVQSKEPYELLVEQDDADATINKISSTDQSTTDAYFNDLNERRIYIQFPDHPIICRLKFTGEESNPCPSMNNQEVQNVDYACYYNPGAEQEPTIEEMEAELAQIEVAEKPEDSEAYVLDLGKPVCVYIYDRKI
jgi:hypothetical protein